MESELPPVPRPQHPSTCFDGEDEPAVRRSKAEHPLAQQISSNTSILWVSLVCGLAVLAGALWLQWLVYHDWLHRAGPLRIVGSLLAAVLTFVFALRLQSVARQRKIEMLRRFEIIADMNDRIRNALQIIECATYAANPEATEPVRYAADRIEAVLKEVLVDTHPARHMK